MNADDVVKQVVKSLGAAATGASVTRELLKKGIEPPERSVINKFIKENKPRARYRHQSLDKLENSQDTAISANEVVEIVFCVKKLVEKLGKEAAIKLIESWE